MVNYQLQFNAEQQRLELINPTSKQKPFYIDFSAGKMAYRSQQGIGRREPLARAVGIKKDFVPTVIDATAGLGRDAFVLATCGCKVTLVERNQILYQLLQDALTRAAKTDLASIIQRMQLHHSSAQHYLQQLTQLPDVIYLDPMFPSRSKTALVKQDLRIVRDVVGDDSDIDELFTLALTTAKKRVVVKRHKLAAPLLNQAPDHIIAGKTMRFDVYVIK